MNIQGVWRFAAHLPPVEPAQRITLGEGSTPLVALPRWGAAHGLAHAYAKLEFANPTGSFKDRGMAVLVSVARAQGARHLVEDSSGNAGASAAAYAARAGLPCIIYAPEAAPAAKLRQIRACGAQLVLVPGPRSAVSEAAREAGRLPGTYHIAHNENALFLAGQKTFAFELLEEVSAAGLLALSSPAAADERAGHYHGQAWHLVIPTGGGALFVGAWQGFTELIESAGPAGQASLPRLHAAQAAGCAPIVAAWEAGLPEPAPIERRPTVCGGIEIERPARGPQILEAIRRSGGTAVASDDAMILAERDRLARLEGLYVEPTSAAALAAAAQLARRGSIERDEPVVVALTGTGLKDPGPETA